MAQDEVELTMVTMAFDAVDPTTLQSVLARYVVLSRGHDGCRNIDLALSATHPNRFVVIQKWASPEDQRAHFDSADMVDDGPGLRGPAGGAPVDRPARAHQRPRSDAEHATCGRPGPAPQAPWRGDRARAQASPRAPGHTCGGEPAPPALQRPEQHACDTSGERAIGQRAMSAQVRPSAVQSWSKAASAASVKPWRLRKW